MKKLILLITVMLVSFTNYSQETIDISASQDVPLAFFKDNHGNNPFTLDLRGEVNLNGKEKWDLGYMTIGLTYEQADLSSGKFVRGGFQGGFTFKYMNLFNIIDYQATPRVGYGRIYRLGENQGYESIELSLDLDFKINSWLNFFTKTTLMQRGDLFKDESSGYNPLKWRLNNYAGIRFIIPVYKSPKVA